MVQENHSDSVATAVAWLLLGVAGGLGLDLCAKELLRSYSLQQFVFLRSVVGLAIFLLLARQFGGFQSLLTNQWRWHLLRTILASGAMFGFFYELSRMPLVDALTLGFTAPLIVTALSVPCLGEHVGWRRWLAVMFGFGGALIGGAVAGYYLWDEVPDRWVVVGATIIIASGLFVVYREIGSVISNRYLRASTAAVATTQDPAPHAND